MGFPKFEDFDPYKNCSLRRKDGTCQLFGRPCQELMGDSICDAVMLVRDDSWIKGYFTAKLQDNR